MDTAQQLLDLIEGYHKTLWKKEIILKRGEHLITAGTADTNIYYVKNGSLQIYYEDDNEFHTIRFGYKGSLFASLDSYFTGKPSVYSVQAIKQSTLKVITKEDFTAFINSSPQTMQLWNMVLSYTVTGLLERELDILTKSPAERYKRVLERSPRLFQEIPQKYIASYLRMAPETLSRLLKS